MSDGPPPPNNSTNLDDIIDGADSYNGYLIISLSVISTITSLWLSLYATANYRFTVEKNSTTKKSKKRSRNSVNSTVSNTSKVRSITQTIPHLFCIGQLGLATSICSLSNILNSIPSWNEEWFCYPINFLFVYGRNTSSLWSSVIIFVLHFLVFRRKGLESEQQKNIFLRKCMLVNWLLPILPSVIVVLIFKFAVDPDNQFTTRSIMDDDLSGWESNCFFSHTGNNENFQNALIANTVIQLLIPGVVSIIGLVLLVHIW